MMRAITIHRSVVGTMFAFDINEATASIFSGICSVYEFWVNLSVFYAGNVAAKFQPTKPLVFLPSARN